MVGVKTVTVRAVEQILRTPGLSLRKCAILVGDPDWSTGVLTEILGLEVGQMLLGTAPCLVVVVMPCVMAGAFMAKYSDGPTTGLLMTAAVLGQSSLMVVATHYIQNEVFESCDPSEAFQGVVVEGCPDESHPGGRV